MRLFFPDLAPRGFTTLIALFLFLGGIQLLCLSIIGSYLAHIYDEVKRRPPYIVESILNPPKERSGGDSSAGTSPGRAASLGSYGTQSLAEAGSVHPRLA